MNQEEIIRIAREAGMEQDGNNFFSPMGEEMDVHISDLKRFADLVVAAECEACAKVCDVIDDGRGDLSAKCAAAIRARKNT